MEQFPLQPPPFGGNSRVVAAGNAFEWLRQGWALFVVNPGLWIAITIVLIVLFLAINIVPFIGWLAGYLLTPMLSAGVLFACQKAGKDELLEISDLFVGFRQNTNALLMLGVLYMVGMLAIVLVVVVIGGGSMLSGMMINHTAGTGMVFGGMMLTLLLTLALSLPLLMALWFAPALVFFNNMPPVEALKSSFNACLKNTLPFTVYGLIALVLLFFAILPVGLGLLVLVPVLSGSVYASYRDIFVAD